MRAVGQESKYYDRVAEGAGATLPIPRHPLRSREWSAGGAGCPVTVVRSLRRQKTRRNTEQTMIFEYVTRIIGSFGVNISCIRNTWNLKIYLF